MCARTAVFSVSKNEDASCRYCLCTSRLPKGFVSTLVKVELLGPLAKPALCRYNELAHWISTPVR